MKRKVKLKFLLTSMILLAANAFSCFAISPQADMPSSDHKNTERCEKKQEAGTTLSVIIDRAEQIKDESLILLAASLSEIISEEINNYGNNIKVKVTPEKAEKIKVPLYAKSDFEGSHICKISIKIVVSNSNVEDFRTCIKHWSNPEYLKTKLKNIDINNLNASKIKFNCDNLVSRMRERIESYSKILKRYKEKEETFLKYLKDVRDQDNKDESPDLANKNEDFSVFANDFTIPTLFFDNILADSFSVANSIKKQEANIAEYASRISALETTLKKLSTLNFDESNIKKSLDQIKNYADKIYKKIDACDFVSEFYVNYSNSSSSASECFSSFSSFSDI